MVKWMIFQNKVLCETFKSHFNLSLNQFVTIWTRLFFKLIFPSVHHLSLCTYSYVIHSYIRMTNKQKKGRPFSCSVFLGQQFLYMKLIGYIIYLYISFEVAQRFFSSLFFWLQHQPQHVFHRIIWAYLKIKKRGILIHWSVQSLSKGLSETRNKMTLFLHIQDVLYG